MLEKYLEEPSRSWDQLANVIDKFSHVAAQRIIELAKKRVEWHQDAVQEHNY